MATVDVLGLTAAAFQQAATLALPHGSGLARRLYGLAHRTGGWDAAAGWTATQAAAWTGAFRIGLLRVVRVMDDGDGLGTAKAILATDDGYEIECVRIPMRRGPDGGSVTWTLCLSSQVGCRMGCAFCETGRMGLLRHLTAAEIVAQVVTARVTLGWQARNLVFMGMGEALDNADALLPALQILTDRQGMGYSQERLTVCTSGHAEGIARLAALGWKRLNLSISLTAGDDGLRSQLMPVNRRTPLAALQQLLLAYPRRRNFCLGVNYCLLPGINDRPEDAAGVATFCRPLGRVLVNIIPYNPGTAPLTRPPTEEEIVAFIGHLRDQGLPVRRRLTKGREIMAACGQLGRRQRIAPGARPASPCADGSAP